MNKIRYTFSKKERLCSARILEKLFEDGNIINYSIFKVVWIPLENLPSPAQAAFSVPKKNFRSAVDRNLIRRRMKEAYRKIKHQLYSELDKRNMQIAFIIILKGQRIPSYDTVEDAMRRTIARLSSDLPVEKC